MYLRVIAKDGSVKGYVKPVIGMELEFYFHSYTEKLKITKITDKSVLLTGTRHWVDFKNIDRVSRRVLNPFSISTSEAKKFGWKPEKRQLAKLTQ